jgi:type IV secretion system protein VirB1
MKHRMKLLMYVCTAISTCGHAQMNQKMQPAQVREMVPHCAPKIHPDTIEAIIRQESAFYPYALSINYPKTEATRQGHANGLYQLARQPRSRHEAITWTRWFLQNGHSVSIGLMQVNTEQASRLGIKDLASLFDPCVNLAAGAVLLQESFRGQPANLSGLSHAFAVYNSGSPIMGTENGYAAGVIAKAPPLKQSDPSSSPLSQHHATSANFR